MKHIQTELTTVFLIWLHLATLHRGSTAGHHGNQKVCQYGNAASSRFFFLYRHFFLFRWNERKWKVATFLFCFSTKNQKEHGPWTKIDGKRNVFRRNFFRTATPHRRHVIAELFSGYRIFPSLLLLRTFACLVRRRSLTIWWKQKANRKIKIK